MRGWLADQKTLRLKLNSSIRADFKSSERRQLTNNSPRDTSRRSTALVSSVHRNLLGEHCSLVDQRVLEGMHHQPSSGLPHLGGGQALGGGQVLGGGEIPVGGPQQMALMFEMIKGMQQNQVELAESLRQLREANGNKEDHQNKNDNRNHEERESHNKNDTPFVTMSDVADLLKQERERPPKEPRHFGAPWNISVSFWIPWDPLLHMVISVCWEFSKSLVDRAYTWYTVLPAGSIRTWEDMARKTALSVKPQVERSRDKKSLPQTLTVSTATTPSGTKRKNSTEKAYEEPPPLPFTAEEMMAIFDKWVQDQVIKLPKISKQPTAEEQKDPKYCRYHRYVNHPTVDCRTLRWEVNRKIQNAGIRRPEARNAATEALITIAAESGATCFTAEAHASHAFLETTNAITFTDEDMEVQYPDHRRPLYLSAVVKDVQVRRALVDTGSCLNLIPLSTLQAANVPQQKIQGSPMEGRLNGKPIRIAANSCSFDQTEAHFVEAALYNDLASTGEPSIVRPCGTPLPAWEDIKDDPEIDLRELLERKKKRKEREVEHGSPPQCPSCHLIQQTENSGKVVVDQLQSTTMSSEEVTVDHAQSTVMNLKEVAVDQTRSTVMNSEEEAMVDQTESTTMRKEKSTTAEPNMTSKEELEMCLLGIMMRCRDRPGVSGSFFECGARYQTCGAAHENLPYGSGGTNYTRAAGHAMFSFMDGFSGYNQIRMSTKDAEKTAFRTPIGNFYYTVMPFGLKNAGATYQRTMTAMFHDMMHKEIEDYVDDIVVKSKKREDHLGILRKVHNRGIDVDPAKASAIATMKAPTSHKELKSFLGRLSYIRRFIPGLAAVTAVFTPLMKKGVPFVWSTACQQAFEKIQVIMTKLPTVCAPVPDLVDSTWTLKFDDSSTANSSGAGIVLIREDGETIAKSFKLDFSCSNNASEYEAYITGLAIAHEMGIKHLRVIGDSNLIICQTKGSKVDVTIDKRSMPITDLLREKFKEQNLDAEDWRTPIKAKLMSPEGVADLKVLKDYVLIAGDLYRRLPGGVLERCVNLQEAAKKLIEVHEKCYEFRDGESLYRRLQRLGYFWPSMTREATSLQGTVLILKIQADFVKSCHTCQLQANLIHTHPTSLQNMATPWPFHTWGLDLIGPINPSSGGYIWILVATEYFSKWVEAIPLRKATGAAVANFIREHIITRFGIPHKIISDNGTPFVNKNAGVLIWQTHYGPTVDQPKQQQVSPHFSLIYGTDAISPTELLVPSSRILHGMDLEADADICAEARVADLEGLEEARELAQVRSLRYHQKLADAYEKTLKTRIFAKGQMVLRTVDHVRRGLPSPSKFAPNWEGPYLIREAYDSGYYKLSTADGTTLVDPINGKWLKRYYS
uniref:Integrase catalytic domain-containing protein n=1 Tax=Fagus sylvatica TaxID=28930 RepID=A0A2N9G2A5_FAGSY